VAFVDVLPWLWLSFRFDFNQISSSYLPGWSRLPLLCFTNLWRISLVGATGFSSGYCPTLFSPSPGSCLLHVSWERLSLACFVMCKRVTGFQRLITGGYWAVNEELLSYAAASDGA